MQLPESAFLHTLFKDLVEKKKKVNLDYLNEPYYTNRQYQPTSRKKKYTNVVT